jgi:malate synthase
MGASVSKADLLQLPKIPDGEAFTCAGLKHGVGIVLAYTEAWLKGVGRIPLHNAMEDACNMRLSKRKRRAPA